MELVLQARAGEREAFDALVSRWQGRAYAQALGFAADPAEAEDIVQEAFVRAYERLEDLREPSAFAGWLGRIVETIALGRLRSRRRPEPKVREEEIRPSDTIEAGEASTALWRALTDLQPEYRAAFLMVHLEGLSYVEVAEQLGVPLSTVKGRLYHAKQILRQRMGTPDETTDKHR